MLSVHQHFGLGLVAVVAGFAGGNAVAQNEFFWYPGCEVEVEGQINAIAEIQTPLWVRTDTDRFDLSRLIPVRPGPYLEFEGRGGVSASVYAIWDDDCRTDAGAEVKGETTYHFVGDSHEITLKIGSSRKHNQWVYRGPSPVFPAGLPVGTFTLYEVPQYDALVIETPITVAGGDGAHVVADFSMKRGDSGPTQGHVVAAWEWYEDVNGNCEVDPGEPVLAFDKWRIGPNDSYIMPTQRFRTPRGNYILVTTYFTLSTLWAESRDCFNPVRAASDVDDGVGYHYELIPG